MAESFKDLVRDWNAWREQRVAGLRQKEGFLALSGLHWLEEGENRLEGLGGVFALRGGEVTLRALAADGYELDGRPVLERTLRSDELEKPDRLRLLGRTLGLIERGGRLAVRVWDADSPALREFRGIDCFPYEPAWRLEARWEGYAEPREVEQVAAVGPPQRARAPGRAHFSVGGQALSLEPTLEADGSLLFLFRDATAARETYGAGRFLSARPPEGDVVVLDFNRSYNPPCAFTPWATCPLPARHNVLRVRIEAGERVPIDHR